MPPMVVSFDRLPTGGVEMPYSPLLVKPMREELTRAGVKELMTAADVDAFINEKTGTAMLVVNSVCGCAAGMARPGVQMALQHSRRPDRVASVFAGQDLEATARARSYLADIPPSSPSIAFWKDGELVYFMPRHRIEGRDAQAVARELATVFDEFCGPAGTAESREDAASPAAAAASGR
jgi:putative YphP/YqiW family bacilliredoxin